MYIYAHLPTYSPAHTHPPTQSNLPIGHDDPEPGRSAGAYSAVAALISFLGKTSNPFLDLLSDHLCRELSVER